MNEDILQKKIGEKERKALEPKPVKVVGFSIDEVYGKTGSKNEGKIVGKKLTLLCKHPDQEEPIKISQGKIIRGEIVKVSTFWINLDEDDNLQKGSAIALMLDKKQASTIRDLEGETLDTDMDNNGYLCIKTY